MTEALTVFSPSLVHKYPPVYHFHYAPVEIPLEISFIVIMFASLTFVRWGTR